MLLQNNHATANLWVKVDGSVAAVGTGIKVGPGGSLELSNTVPTNAILAISDTASTNVTFVEA